MEGGEKSESRCVLTLCDGVWIEVSTRTAEGLEKIQANRGTNNRQRAQIYTYIPIQERTQRAGRTSRQSKQ